MPLIKKILAGRKAKSSGEQFERIVRNSAEMRGWKVTQHPSGCKRVWTPKGVMVKDLHTEFDFTFGKNAVAIFADAKFVSTVTFCFSMVKPHQANALFEYEKRGFMAGYIVLFSELDVAVFFKSSQLISLKPRQSLSPSDGIHLGNSNFIHIDQLLKKESPR